MPGKKYQEAVKLVDAKKLYSPSEALELAKKTSTVKFDASIEVHCHLGIDPAKSDQAVRATLTFPHGTGKSKRIAAFVDAANEKAAEEAGADIVGGDRLIDEIASSGKIDFDVAIATPPIMAKLAKVAKVLGPKGLMPNPKSETVTTDVKKTIAELKRGKVTFKNDDTGNVHQVLGKVSFDTQKLLENFQTLLEALRKAKPSSSKGIYLQSCTISASMGPAIKVSI
ncbi:50S ribosomal protein L1 [Candidatus Uhrbacteria bacterium RIFCSPLOWO2_01_FULL_47_24]|uniref:Large ribosomal subunit protein uL1 n=1 Tax=Candidatus Uhrbacteria bacterium RIFCSPLOWO2_01_FULL_47_24 TaxID=1802401 RepID=A0A1F7UPD8_9BACT|nr:MAG: 50S ribosomal protein L1 [Candidatus Uhrbacteria bacterium RIFCSPHIGHO2_01_FULL_47_11]OGL67919.1 MAG: 50S ribosomal protein L1 [Candidatus Uhrbacteria bacterium RIFCSPHIGHO2_02_FULL_46_47]OGL75190.1 MAG: 50S ribosomal protein L1 [Candidatus Uhrbacteria bacterium RIFCSPHIGHO2_12_FULL_47_11]OGL80105.1 MAG: 50S ribosomal protein L1 [Candidatus Uhrbacteria bacterium RIFCSPLOWO2_01_FULL_47_24]OGL84891.1 MAG: 50S ribosomal protein L1 [Candidatus Uhrbacteria bacterium RIFCSPLOWO2_02_FULL_46_25